MSVIGSNILSGASGQGGAYDIDQSLRFDDGSSTKLERTPASAGSLTTWTFSAWVKRGNLGATQHIMGTYVSGTNIGEVVWHASDNQFQWEEYNGGTIGKLRTNARFRDLSAWYHIVCRWDTTNGTAGNRMRLYINGVEETSFAIDTNPSSGASSVNNTAYATALGVRPDGSGYLDGYLAEVHFIDGTALGPESFGETDAATNQWKPIEATGLTYGTNGFYQKYSTPYGIESFTSTGANTWTCPTGVTSIELLVVAGGGGGGGESGSGGGGGGVVHDSAYSVTPGVTYDITVGAGGGEGGQWGHIIGANGGNSVFNVNAEGSGSTITAIGGGSGAGRANNAGRDGGSGGCGDGSGADGVTTQETLGTATGGTINAYGENAPGGTQGGGAGELGDGSGKSFANFTSYGLSGVFGAGNDRTTGGSQNSAADGAANTGNAGEGSNTGGQSGYGGYGGTGVVLIAVDAGLGADSSGNGNNFTPTNLVATDQMIDTPTNNFCTLNPLVKAVVPVTFSEGNLKAVPDTNWEFVAGTIPMTSGKWYWELRSFSGASIKIGITPSDNDLTTSALATSLGILYHGGGQKVIDDVWSAYGASYTTGDIIGYAVDMDGSTITFYKNNVSQGAIAFSGSVTTAQSVIASGGLHTSSVSLNFGQDSSFAGNVTAQGNGGTGEDFYYTPPTGFVALNTDNLSDPAIALPTDHFNTLLYSGDNNDNRAVTGVGFQPDLLWIKKRNGTGNNKLYGVLPGVGSNGQILRLTANTNIAEQDTTDEVDSLDSDGFTIDTGGGDNATGGTYVAWNWKAGGAASTIAAGSIDGTNPTIASSVSANPTAGFSTVKYTGNATSGATVGHGLSVTPELIIIKNTAAAVDWIVYSEPVGATAGLQLNGTGASYTYTAYFNNTAPTASVFSLGDYSGVNANTEDMIAYCFNSVEGYSKVGSYEGNNTTDNVMVYTGFRPAFVLIKCIPSATTNWGLFDNKREGYNVDNDQLQANTTAVESTTDFIDIVSNGFKVRSAHSDVGSGSEGYMYYAVASSPFKYSNAR